MAVLAPPARVFSHFLGLFPALPEGTVPVDRVDYGHIPHVRDLTQHSKDPTIGRVERGAGPARRQMRMLILDAVF